MCDHYDRYFPEDLGDADRRFKKSLESVNKTEPVFGEWQLCPKCNGTGNLQPPYEIVGTIILTGKCDVCNGNKILAKPIIR